MPFARGVLSYTLFRVSTEIAHGWKDALLNGLTRGRISPVDVALGKDRAIGFATFFDPLDTEFTIEKVVFGELALFSLRVDKLVVPASTLKLHTRQRISQVLAETRREKLSRQEKEEIAAQVRRDLLQRALPSISAFEVVWHVSARCVRIATTSQSVAEEFAVRAREFLGIELKPMNVVGVLEINLPKENVERVYRLAPVSFAPASSRMEVL